MREACSEINNNPPIKLPDMFTPFRADLKIKARKLRIEMTPAEKKLWFGYLRGEASQKFLRQKPIGNCIVDFYCAAKGLVIEVDGDGHFEDEGIRRDLVRDNYLEKVRGLRVLRFTNFEVMKEFEGVCLVVEEWLK